MAPVPQSGPNREAPFGEQLDQVLTKQKVAVRELARRLAAKDGTKLESKRRWLLKYLSPEAKGRPKPESVAAIEEALGLRPGYFKVLEKEPREAREAREANIDRRLAALEEQATRDVVKLRKDLNAAIRRIHVLEQQAPREARPGEARK